jgi:hypothetical protein
LLASMSMSVSLAFPYSSRNSRICIVARFSKCLMSVKAFHLSYFVMWKLL